MGKGYRFIAPVTIIDASPNADSPAVPTETAASESIPAVPAPRSPRSHAKLWLAVAALILLAATLALTLGPHPLAARLLHPNPAPPASPLSLSFPLDNLSGDPNQEYFADGMTDELTTMLAKDSTLRIVSRTSVMQYKKARRPLPEIARALGVDGIVEGSVARSGNQVHLTLQLIRAETDSHLWAESYDRDRTPAGLRTCLGRIVDLLRRRRR
jgi:TolB-like protein